MNKAIIPIDSINFKKCSGFGFLTVVVFLFLGFTLPPGCVGQKITTIDPNAASSKSVEDLSKASLSGSQGMPTPQNWLKKLTKKTSRASLSPCNGVPEIEFTCMWSFRQK